MMTQNILPFQYLNGKNDIDLTSFAGLPLYMEMAIISGLNKAIAKELQSKSRGWSDLQILISLILLNIAGGGCVDDIERLEADEGLSILLLRLETRGMKRKERRAYERRWRKQKTRAFPSAASIYRYLEQFHNESEEGLREKGKAFIPLPNELLQSLLKINSTLIDYGQQHHCCETATLDQDATLSATHKKTAYYCYEKYKAYQPFNTYWSEQGLLLHSEFRDGNVFAGFEQLRVLQESLAQLPKGVNKVLLRSDSAGYQEDLLRYCAEGKNERFGIIEFGVAVKVTPAFKQAVAQIAPTTWQPIYKEEDGQQIKTEQEWAEVCFVPTWVGLSKKTPNYRFIAIREAMSAQPELEGFESIQQELPFQTIQFDQMQYKLFGMVTNRTLSGNELINWHRKRCGDSEKVHSIEKGDLAGGQFPSNKFGANAAWWQVMILAFNLNRLMQLLVLPDQLKYKRLKGLRFYVIGIAGRVIQHARGLFIKLSGGQKVADLFYQIRQNIFKLANAPPLLALA
jgi:hypothetical protein